MTQTTIKNMICLTALAGWILLSAGTAQAQRGGYSGRSSYGGYGGRSSFGGGYSSSRGGYGGGYGSYGMSQDGSRPLGTAQFQYDPDTGSVIVIADEETHERIKQVIEGLDQPVPQVLIKVLFLEVTHGDSLDIGVEGKLKGNKGDKVSELSSILGIANEVAAGSNGGYYKIIDGDLEATIRAIAETNKLEVLSRPSILARNNQEATIMVGQEIPFITDSRITDSGQQINTVSYGDVGIILRVTPHIAPEKMVEMQVSPEISSLTGDGVPLTGTTESPIIAMRYADTRVLVGDGKTVVIGGMMEHDNIERIIKVPLLGDIPYLGALFRRTIKDKTKTELLIFLTPLVVEAPDELNAITAKVRETNELMPQTFTKQEMDRYLDLDVSDIKKGNPVQDKDGTQGANAAPAKDTQQKGASPAPAGDRRESPWAIRARQIMAERAAGQEGTEAKSEK